LSTAHKVVLSLILWATATSWSAILESKKWATWLEGARLLAMGVFFGVLGAAAVLPLPWAAAGAAVSAVSMAWVATLGRTTQSSSFATE
jgi:hypothetical protein